MTTRSFATATNRELLQQFHLLVHRVNALAELLERVVGGGQVDESEGALASATVTLTETAAELFEMESDLGSRLDPPPAETTKAEAAA